MRRNASAIWKGGFKDGKGTISTASGVLSNTPHSFKARFECKSRLSWRGRLTGS